MASDNEVFNAKEAAEFLGAYVETIRRLARKGELPAYKIGKDWRFRKEDLLTWAKTHYLQRKPPKILVIESDAGVRKLMNRYLETESYQVRFTSEGAEGLEWLKRESIDLIVLGLKMPGMNGPAFLRQFRKDKGTVPVIVTTGYPDGELMAEAIKYGPITLIAKPIDKRQLIEAVGTALNGIRASHKL